MRVQSTNRFLTVIAFQGQNESAAIMKLKESLEGEVKRFEKDGDQQDYFMQ